MFESRCGVCCNQCERKEAVRCTGCATMEKPFWGGECGVKSCCEAKGLNTAENVLIFPVRWRRPWEQIWALMQS